ncbi:MAG: hypothetical protein IJD80_02745 [Oscillospiraceae bacterium]|nr:hypothetical protein [Oscillospiraceae bacterium]
MKRIFAFLLAIIITMDSVSLQVFAQAENSEKIAEEIITMAADSGSEDISALKAEIYALPTVEELEEKTDINDEIYVQILDLYNRYMSLTGAEKKQIPDAEQIFNNLLDYFDKQHGEDGSVEKDEHYKAVKAEVEKMVKAYAAEVYMPNAGSDAIEQLLYFSIFSRKPTLKLTRTSPLVAAVWNTVLFQEGLIEGTTDTVFYMQKNGAKTLETKGGVQWRSYGSSYSINGASSQLKSNLSANDYAMTYVIGGMAVALDIAETKRNSTSASYVISVKISDDFDFNGEYSGADELGYDATFEKYLTGIGGILGGNLLNEFYWEFESKFSIEVPFKYYCNHLTGSYRWEFNAENKNIYAIETNNFIPNRVENIPVESQNGKQRYFYRMNDTVKLLHDKPWYVEYEMVGQTLIISPTASSYSVSSPSIFQVSRNRTHFREYVPDENGKIVCGDYGLPWKTDIANRVKYLYTLENVPHGDNKNTIWCRVYDSENGECLIETPLIHHYKYDEDRNYIYTHTDETCAYGDDFYLEFIGCRGLPVNATKNFILKSTRTGKKIPA